ncbi:MAG: amino acid adenylation domain-containing protein, partial [Gemmatimonadetes bacterium]|nr:amino acid adenylation domain-containing protein [Gemmatimonadota bacterium]
RQAGGRLFPERVRPRGTDGPVPLSFAQQRLWFIDRMEPGSSAYNLPTGLRLRGALDHATLERTLTEVVRRHEALRTVFAVVDGEAVQVIHPAAPVVLPTVELGGLAGEARARETERLVRDEARRPFDLERGPLLRCTLLRLGEEGNAVLFTMHHIVSDGWSMGVLTREVTELYAAFAAGRLSPLPELPIQYPDFALWQRGWLTGANLEAQLGYWRERLAGAPPVLELPTDRPRPPVPGARGATRGLVLSAEASRALRELAGREGATLFMTLLAGWQLLLARYAGADDVVVGTPIAGRGRLEVEGLIGFFVNTLVLRTDLSGTERLTFRELLARVRETTLGAQSHQELPFERLVEELQPERSLQHTPLFQVLFALQNNERGELKLGETEVEALGGGGGGGAAKFDLDLSMQEDEERIWGVLSYRAELWEAATIERMLEHFRAVLEAVAAAPSRPVAEIELLAGAEREQVLRAWNATARDYPARPVHEQVAAQAASTPDALAVTFEGETLTYAELNARANRLAHHLRRVGVGPEVPVGLCVERSAEMLVGVLGILKAGGAFVPLDPGYPSERLSYILSDAALPVLVTAGSAADALPEYGAAVVRLDAAALAEESAAEPAPLAGPEHLAYVIYTSGSTGRPKGVWVQHGSLANLVAATREAYGIRAGDVMPSLASFAFDIWLFETLLPLSVGGTVRIVPRERVMEPERLVGDLGGCTLLHAVPALMRQIVRAPGAGEALASLRAVFVGGDLVPSDLLVEVREALPGAALYEMYGPTEGTILASRWRVPAAGEIEGRIGTPLGNVRLYVTDPAGNAQPTGVPGELRIGGVQVARGYLGRPDLTAASFVPDAFSGEAGARLYRTGDRVRWLASGELEFLGRTDAQVKVRGFRIEPGEIEAVLERHALVGEAVVVVRDDASGAGERRLVAYVVPADGVAPEAADLRTHLKGSVPEYMVPSAFVTLDALP